ncbi:calcium-binding protein, partial [uncultured Sulfitobacter sp.]|uniref:calcium-binding protein n=1 Tax=uncultured Sulfitobacter sp. TaxID=191468 RepID=UPI00260F10CE
MATPATWLSAFQVNTGAGATGGQSAPKIIGLSNGNILVAYEANAAGTIGTGANADIVGKIYTAEGGLFKSEFQLNTSRNADNERDFSIAATNDGGFMIVYMDDDTNNVDTDLVLQRYDDAGDVIGGATIVASDVNATGNIGTPRLLINQSDNSGFISWDRTTTTGDQNIRAKHFEINVLNNVQLSAGFDAAQNSTQYDRDHETAMLTTGEMVVVYEEDDGGIQSMEVRIYNTAGALTHSNLSSLPSGVTGNPKVAGLSNGNFVVVWEDDGDAFGQIFNNSAGTVGAQFTVENGSDNINEIQVVALPGPASGDFVVIWDDDTDGRTEMRQFNASGSFDGSQVIAIDEAGTSQSIGVSSDGRILVAHQEEVGEITAAIFDSRNALDIDASDFSNEPVNFVSTTVVTGKQQGTDFDGNTLDNTFYGQGNADTITGLSGEDSLFGGNGNDIISGGSGDDSIRGEGNNDTLSGGTGNDTITGDNGSDTLDYSYSAPPPPPLLSIAGSWNITFGSVVGSATFSNFFGVQETDQIWTVENLIGSGWRDVVDIRSQDNTTNRIETFNGNDEVITGRLTTNNDTLDGGDGTDKLTVDGVYVNTVTYDLGAEEVRVSGLGKTADIISFENIEIDGGEGVIGTDGANNILVNNSFVANNVIEGRGGEDTIQGGNGSDSIDGGSGEDLFIDNMEDGSTTILGGTSDDTLDLSGATGGVTGGAGSISSNTTTATLTLNSIQDLIGTDFADDISEETGGNLNGISLGLGNDTLRGTVNGTSDVFDGGDGIDTYIETSSNSRVLDLEGEVGGSIPVPLIDFENATGGGGNDTITGTHADANILIGMDGLDIINGLDGDDTLEGGAGDDTLNGGRDNDRLDGGDDQDRLEGSTGEDTLLGQAGNDTLFGQGDNDVLRGGDGIDLLDGGGGNDLLSGGGNSDTLSGGTGADTLQGGKGSDSIEGGDGADDIAGGDGTDSIYGGDNNDTISGGNNSDLVFGQNGSDLLEGGSGNDTLSGGSGNDTLDGGGGADSLDGGAWSDTLTGGGGNDTLRGGTGNDSLEAGDGRDLVLGGSENDTINGGIGDDTLGGQADNDVIDGGEGNDRITGGDGTDSLTGGADNDTILGGDG